MRVLHVINIGGFGGGEKLLLQLLPAQEELMQTGLVLCYQPASEEVALKIKNDLAATSVKVFCLPYKSVLSIQHLRNLRAYINSGEWDLVHTHLQHANMWVNLLRRLRLSKKPVVTTLHGYRDSYQNDYGLLVSRKIYFSKYYWITRFNLKRLDGHIVISRCLRDFFLKSHLLQKKTMRVIYHGYDSTQLVAKTTAPANEKIESPVIGLPGRFIKLKGHVYALQMLKLLREQYPTASIHFFGTGPYMETIVAETERLQLTDCVHFRGYIHNLLDELKKCDFAVLPSVYESFGLVFLDCFAAGVPVIAFDLPAGNEIIKNGETGILVRPFDVPELARAAAGLCENAALRNSLVEKGRESLLSDFSISRMAREYYEYYHQIIQSKLRG